MSASVKRCGACLLTGAVLAIVAVVTWAVGGHLWTIRKEREAVGIPALA